MFNSIMDGSIVPEDGELPDRVPAGDGVPTAAYARATLGVARAPFLVLTPACLLVGFAVAGRRVGQIDPVHAALVLLGALAAHVAVNALNEYGDFRNGLDLMTRRTPFSGGSGTLPAQPQFASLALTLAVAAAVVTVLVGLYFMALRGTALLPVGVAGMLLVLGYTHWITRHPWLCLLAPGLGFGPLMIAGTAIALGAGMSMSALVASLPPMFLCSGLLLLNQVPDIEADRRVGRRHIAVLWGARRATRLYAALVLAAHLSLIAGVAAGVLPATTLLGLLTLPLALAAIRGALRHADDPLRLLPALGLNVALCVATPVLIAAGLWVA